MKIENICRKCIHKTVCKDMSRMMCAVDAIRDLHVVLGSDEDKRRSVNLGDMAFITDINVSCINYYHENITPKTNLGINHCTTTIHEGFNLHRGARVIGYDPLECPVKDDSHE